MELYHQPGGCPPAPARSVVTIGAYDGVHLGHRHLIGMTRAMAAELGARSVVVTFDRHPAAVVRPDTAPRLLTDLAQKLELLAATAVDATLLVRFDAARAAESPEDFVREVLVGCVGVRAVVVGHDFHFGKARSGDVPLLQRMGVELGFDVLGSTLVPDHAGDQPVSSTRIRTLLSAGDVADAARLLGRPHEVRGRVDHGDARGRQLGFPTANVAVPAEILLPADGIYAGWYVRPDGTSHRAALSLGRRPTFYAEARQSLLEAHLLDFAGDLYGEEARVRFVSRLRGERRFDSVDELVAQMDRDVEATRDRLGA